MQGPCTLSQICEFQLVNDCNPHLLYLNISFLYRTSVV